MSVMETFHFFKRVSCAAGRYAGVEDRTATGAGVGRGLCVKRIFRNRSLRHWLVINLLCLLHNRAKAISKVRTISYSK